MLYTYPGLVTNPISLDAGFQLVVVNALAVGGSGVANSQVFTVPEEFGSSGATLTLTAVPNGAVSAVTVDIEVSADGGVTWAKKHVSVALIAASVNTQAVESNLQPGLLYRINPTTITGGASVTIVATAS
jgi:hypothetical protein